MILLCLVLFNNYTFFLSLSLYDYFSVNSLETFRKKCLFCASFPFWTKIGLVILYVNIQHGSFWTFFLFTFFLPTSIKAAMLGGLFSLVVLTMLLYKHT